MCGSGELRWTGNLSVNINSTGDSLEGSGAEAPVAALSSGGWRFTGVLQQDQLRNKGSWKTVNHCLNVSLCGNISSPH